MLSKKQYRMTLLTAIIVFFVLLVLNAWYFSRQGWTGEKSAVHVEELPKELTQDGQAVDEVTILPQTKVILKVADLTTQKEEQATLDSSSLLGLNKEELEERFEDYTVEVFDEKEVCLKKEIASREEALKPVSYVLGVSDENVCIKEKNAATRPVKIDYQIDHLSSYTYSLLLNEEIEITQQQKEALLLNPKMLQRILQDYVGE